MTFERFVAFDHLPVSSNVNVSGEGVFDEDGGSTRVVTYGGRRMWQSNGPTEYGQINLPAPAPQATAACRTVHASSSTGSTYAVPLIQWRSGSTVLIHVFTDGSGNIQVRQGTTVLGVAARTILTLRYIEGFLSLGGAGNDSFVLRIDGEDELTLTGLTLAGSQVTGVRFRGSGGGSGIQYNFADIRVAEIEPATSPFRGPVLMRWLPVREDVSVQWTRNGGASNASRLVDPNGSDFAATYIESHTLGEIDEYTLEPLPESVNSIIAVVPVSVSHAPSGGAPQIRRSLKTSAGVVPGPEQTVGVSGWRSQMHAVHEKPGGGGWSRAAVNELRIFRESG